MENWQPYLKNTDVYDVGTISRPTPAGRKVQYFADYRVHVAGITVFCDSIECDPEQEQFLCYKGLNVIASLAWDTPCEIAIKNIGGGYNPIIE